MQTIADVNYSPLTNYNQAFGLGVKSMIKNKHYLLLLGLGLLVLVGTIVAKHGIGWGIFIVAAEFIGFSVLEMQKAQKAMWVDFAAVNGWPVVTSGLTGNYVPLSLSYQGHSKNCSPVVEATIDNTKWHIFEYNYTVGSGRNSHTYYFTVVQVKLAKKLPYIALDSKKNTSGLRNYPEGTQKVSLEGDFDKYFTLMSQVGANIDVLSIITPDVMQTLIDCEQQQDIEIIDDNAYFIAANDQRNARSLQLLMVSVDKLLEELQHRVSSLSYDSTQVFNVNGKTAAAITQSNVVYKSHLSIIVRAILIGLSILFIINFVTSIFRVRNNTQTQQQSLPASSQYK